VHFLNGKEDVINVDPSYTLSKVKESISHSAIHKYMRLVHGGRTMTDQKTVADYKIKEGDKLFLVFDLRGGGNDGGSIPTRGEMVKTKRTIRRTDPVLLKRAKWLNCALSKQILQSPIVVDDLGNVFNKEPLLKCLVEKSMPQRFSYIRTIKNVFDAQFSLNRKYDPSQQVQVGKEAANLDSPYECLITGRPVNGQHAFSVIKTCGHIFSEKGLQQSKSQTLACFICQKPYKESDLVQLNPDEQVQETLRLKLQLSIKEKKHKHHKGTPPTEQDKPKDDKSKHPKTDLNTNEEKKTEKRKSSPIESKRPNKKQKVTFSPPSTTQSVTGPTAQNVLAVKDALSKVRDNHDAKKRTSDAYKSIFSSNHQSAPAYLTGIPRAVIK